MASIADYGDYDINTIETIITFLSKTENNGILNNKMLVKRYVNIYNKKVVKVIMRRKQ